MWYDILLVVISVAVAFAIIFFVFRRAKRWGNPKKFTEHTIGILRKVQRTGMYVNEQPQLVLSFDAVLADGSPTPVTVTEIVSLTDLHRLKEGGVFAICYDPESCRGSFDGSADKEHLQDMFDRYMAKRNPRGFTYEQRVALRTRGIRRKALLTDLRLTGEEEEGCREVKLTVRIDEKDGSERILQRTSWMTEAELESLVVGKLVTLEIVEDDPPWFSILQDAELFGTPA